jgi:hypothetical protein
MPQYYTLNIILYFPDGSFGIVTGYGLDGRGTLARFPAEATNIFFSTESRQVLAPTQPPTHSVPGIEWQIREADHSPPTSATLRMVEPYLHYPTRFPGVVHN